MDSVTRHVNKQIVGVALNPDKERFAIHFDDGTVARFYVTAECCSSSWIEHLEMPPDVIGATLTGADDSDCVSLQDEEYDCLKVYTTTFHTTKGDIVLEYRNSSNGYYGGTLEEENEQ